MRRGDTYPDICYFWAFTIDDPFYFGLFCRQPRFRISKEHIGSRLETKVLALDRLTERILVCCLQM